MTIRHGHSLLASADGSRPISVVTDRGQACVASDVFRRTLTVVLAHPGVPLELVDEQTHMAYVLLPADEFQRLKTAVDDDLADTYPAQVESALWAGWDHPRMDQYNDYEARRQRKPNRRGKS